MVFCYLQKIVISNTQICAVYHVNGSVLNVPPCAACVCTHLYNAPWTPSPNPLSHASQLLQNPAPSNPLSLVNIFVLFLVEMEILLVSLHES